MFLRTNATLLEMAPIAQRSSRAYNDNKFSCFSALRFKDLVQQLDLIKRKTWLLFSSIRHKGKMTLCFASRTLISRIWVFFAVPLSVTCTPPPPPLWLVAIGKLKEVPYMPCVLSITRTVRQYKLILTTLFTTPSPPPPHSPLHWQHLNKECFCFFLNM